jgi:flagellar hook protein FlgE
MMRSMFAGVSGLRAHQTMTDVVANNIANVNTIGFKASRVQFADTLAQQLRGGNGQGDAATGTNPQQVGLGVNVASTNRSFSQGGLQLTGRPTDVAITGDGFFMISFGGQDLFTRAGSFSLDDRGNLTDPTGGFVLGWNADVDGRVDSNEEPIAIQVATNTSIQPVATARIDMAGNLDADAVIGDIQRTAIDVIDGQGKNRRMSLEFELTAPNTWAVTVTDPEGNSLGTDTIEFDASSGALVSTTTNPTYTYNVPDGTPFTFELNLGEPGSLTALTQYAGSATAAAVGQNGQQPGNLTAFAITADGSLTGVFSNGQTRTLAQLALATFNNPSGLLTAGDNRFRETEAAGERRVDPPNQAGKGGISAGTLEMSNVDLSEEFTNLIIAQRGFQANSRIITVSDEMIQELVNLKR